MTLLYRTLKFSEKVRKNGNFPRHSSFLADLQFFMGDAQFFMGDEQFFIADTQFFITDAQFFRADAQFFAAGVLLACKVSIFLLLDYFHPRNDGFVYNATMFTLN